MPEQDSIPDVCQHKIPRKKWSFNCSPYAVPQGQTVFIMNADSCPDCLQERIKNLREAFRLLMEGSRPVRDNITQAAKAEKALGLYYDDLKGWL